jgi:F0F1-type ATP synthase membrane subunit c/vacuolar-type H+-ATPase subunit K
MGGEKMKINVFLFSLLIVSSILIVPVMADDSSGKIANTKDLLGNPLAAFNSLPSNLRNDILLISGLLFAGALLCIAYGIVIAIGKQTVGKTTKDAKMRSEGFSDLFTIIGIVVVAVFALMFVFWFFNPLSI